MEHLIKSVNLTDEKDLSLERLEDRIEFIAPMGVADCAIFYCGTNTK